jgi:hypothetical protein
MSTWYLREKPKNGVDLSAIDDLFADSLVVKQAIAQAKKLRSYVASEVVVSGTVKEIPRMIGSPQYLFRVYTKIFGREKAERKMNDGKLEVVKVELSDITHGMGVGCLTDG